MSNSEISFTKVEAYTFMIMLTSKTTSYYHFTFYNNDGSERHSKLIITRC